MITTSTTMPKILVTGANGQLAEAIRHVAPSYGGDYTFASIADLDICNTEAIERYLADNQIDVIINTAAYTDVEGAEDNEALAMAVNGDAVRELARISQRRGIKLIHISTDYVFGGDATRRTPYNESDEVAPISAYGRTKAAGEMAVVRYGGVVIRTAWLYSPWGKNFMLTISRIASEHEEISVVDDQRGTPTSAVGLAQNIATLIASGAINQMEGIYNYTDGGDSTWYDFAREIVARRGHNCHVKACTTAERNMQAKRPAYSVLDTRRIRSIEGVIIEPWQERLTEVITLLNREI